MMDVSAIG